MNQVKADVSLAAFLQLVEKSRILDRGTLERVAARSELSTARSLANALVQAGDLTHFQAEKLLRGHWRGLAVGPYRILAPLGRGGMGTVYLARDSRLAMELGDQILVALKVLPPRVAREEERMLHRFYREFEMGQRVNHVNVVRTLAGGDVDGVNYIALEYVPGKTLRTVVEQGGRLTVGDAARVFADVAAGLAHLHECGLIHRDLKPANVMVTPVGQAKVLDLGLALAPFDPRPTDPAVVGGVGYVLGTMDYIAPEQARNATDVNPRSDLYALGCSLYFTLTGTPPFPGGTSKDKIRWQRTLEPAPIRELNPSVPVEFASIVESLMTKDPAGRPGSAMAVRELLLPWVTAARSPTLLSIEATVGVVDKPDAHPDLWTEGSDVERELPGEEEDPQPRTQWWIAGIVLLALVALMILLTLLRRL